MFVIKDQLGRELQLTKYPQKIISLVPSQTELLFSLGLDEEVIAITSFCIHPPSWKVSKKIIGGTKKLHLSVIDALQPDLIIANKEENERSQVETLASRYPVYISDISNLQEAFRMMMDVGGITGKAETAVELIEKIQARFDLLSESYPQKLRVAYLIWRNPYMTVGGGTFIHEMLEKAGFENVFSALSRYPVVTLKQILETGCDVVLLSSEPYPFDQKHVEEIKKINVDLTCLLVNGELFSWYGSRLLDTPPYLQQIRKRVAALSFNLPHD